MDKALGNAQQRCSQTRHDTTRHDNWKLERLTAELQDLYTKRELMLPEHQYIMFDNISNHLDKPLDTIENWITIYTPTILHSIQQAEVRATANTRSMIDYFPTRQRTSTRQPSRNDTATGQSKPTPTTTKHPSAKKQNTSLHLRQQQKKFRAYCTAKPSSSTSAAQTTSTTRKTPNSLSK